MKLLHSYFFVAVLFSHSLLSNAYEREVIEAFTKVGAGGVGNESAARIAPSVKKLSLSSILPLLNAMNTANALGDNWIRASLSQILDQTDEVAFPRGAIKDFAMNRKNEGSSRRAAFELLLEHNSEFASSMVPEFLNDPEPSLRREAVARLLKKANSSKNNQQSRSLYEEVLANGTDVSQIKEASSALKGMGQNIDLVALMGFLVDWKIVGPFDNSGRAGFQKSYPPEKKNLESYYHGKNGTVRWTSFSSKDPMGMVDVNQLYGEIKEVLAFAKTNFYSSTSRKVQLRIGSKNAWKIWLNGDLLFARDEYHRGSTRIDQFIVGGELKKGKNEILVKVCQNEQTQSWTKQWEFCLRITDQTGTPIPSIPH